MKNKILFMLSFIALYNNVQSIEKLPNFSGWTIQCAIPEGLLCFRGPYNWIYDTNLDIPKGTTNAGVKKLIHEKFNFDPNNIKLINAGRIVEDDSLFNYQKVYVVSRNQIDSDINKREEFKSIIWALNNYNLSSDRLKQIKLRIVEFDFLAQEDKNLILEKIKVKTIKKEKEEEANYKKYLEDVKKLETVGEIFRQHNESIRKYGNSDDENKKLIEALLEQKKIDEIVDNFNGIKRHEGVSF